MANIDRVWEFSSEQVIGADGYSTDSVDLSTNVGTYPQMGALFLNCVMVRGIGTSLTSLDVILRTGTGTDGSDDLNAGIYELMSRLTLHSDRDLTTANNGLVLLSQSMPLGITARYIQVYYDFDTESGTGMLIDCWAGLSPINEQLSIQEGPA